MGQADSEMAANAGSEATESSLWQAASERVLLHATILRALRFGEQPPPGFQQQNKPANKSDQAAQRSSPACSTANTPQTRRGLAASIAAQPAEADTRQRGPASGRGISRIGPVSAARQQAAALLVEQPQAIRCLSCAASCNPIVWFTVIVRRRMFDHWLLRRGWQQRPLVDMARGGLMAHAPAVLHDMAACVAEAVATVYLAEVRGTFSGFVAVLISSKPSMFRRETACRRRAAEPEQRSITQARD